MSADRTVLVIGAGIGAETQMPMGRALLKSVASRLHFRRDPIYDRDSLIMRTIRNHVSSREKLPEHVISSDKVVRAAAHAESIDHLIHMHRADEKVAFCAKLAITECILDAERSCKLLVREERKTPRLHPSAVENTWLSKLVQLFCRGVQFTGVVNRLKRTTFIIFNYDRCVETFLYEALQAACSETAEAIAEALSVSTFIHPYGHVGFLPWQEPNHYVEFGDDTYGDRLLELSQGIRTFHEQQSDLSEVAQIRDAMRTADRIAFLGFGYHSMNMELLYPGMRGESNIVLGTTYGMTDDNVRIIEAEIQSNLSGTRSDYVSLKDLGCRAFMDYFDKRLSYA